MDRKERVALITAMGRRMPIVERVQVLLKLLRGRKLTYCGVLILGTLAFLTL